MCEAVTKIICVREDHGVIEAGEAKEAKNTIVSIDPETQEQFILVYCNKSLTYTISCI